MARLDVYPMPGRGGRGYVLDVQAKVLGVLASRVVVPLMPAANVPAPIAGLNPVFYVDGAPHVMLTQAIAAVPAKELRVPVTSLDSRHDDVTRALDILFLGH
jgi:toxin CcdB